MVLQLGEELAMPTGKLTVPPLACSPLLQLGAGEVWQPDTSYQWKGFNGSWEGFGPSIAVQVGAGGQLRLLP